MGNADHHAYQGAEHGVMAVQSKTPNPTTKIA